MVGAQGTEVGARRAAGPEQTGRPSARPAGGPRTEPDGQALLSAKTAAPRRAANYTDHRIPGHIETTEKMAGRTTFEQGMQVAIDTYLTLLRTIEELRKQIGVPQVGAVAPVQPQEKAPTVGDRVVQTEDISEDPPSSGCNEDAVLAMELENELLRFETKQTNDARDAAERELRKRSAAYKGLEDELHKTQTALAAALALPPPVPEAPSEDLIAAQARIGELEAQFATTQAEAEKRTSQLQTDLDAATKELGAQRAEHARALAALAEEAGKNARLEESLEEERAANHRQELKLVQARDEARRELEQVRQTLDRSRELEGALAQERAAHSQREAELLREIEEAKGEKARATEEAARERDEVRAALAAEKGVSDGLRQQLVLTRGAVNEARMEGSQARAALDAARRDAEAAERAADGERERAQSAQHRLSTERRKVSDGMVQMAQLEAREARAKDRAQLLRMRAVESMQQARRAEERADDLGRRLLLAERLIVDLESELSEQAVIPAVLKAMKEVSRMSAELSLYLPM